VEDSAVQRKITAKEFDEAFDSLAAFLFEQYKNKKLNTK
jgi:hypothetical protein